MCSRERALRPPPTILLRDSGSSLTASPFRLHRLLKTASAVTSRSLLDGILATSSTSRSGGTSAAGGSHGLAGE